MRVKMLDADAMLKRIQIDNRTPHVLTRTRGDYQRALMKLAGQEVEVETDYLFGDQYNTPPIEGISEIGLRLFDRHVEAIIDDVRPGMVKCSWCGAVYHDTGAYCHSSEYIRPLLPVFYRDAEALYRRRGYDEFGRKYNTFRRACGYE